MIRNRVHFRPSVEGLDRRAAASSLAVTPDFGLMATLFAPRVTPAPPANFDFTDGGWHMISKPTGWIQVDLNTSLVVEPGAVISGMATLHGNQYTASVNGEGCTILMLGGTIKSPDNTKGIGLFEGEGTFIATGGQIQDGAVFRDPNLVLITGGSFTSPRGIGMSLSTGYNSYVRIAGGTFTGARAADGTPGWAMRIDETGGTVDIYGGRFSGTIGIAISARAGSDSMVNFYGTGLNYSAKTGMLTGRLASGDPLNVHIAVVSPAWPFAVSGSGREVTFHGTLPT